MTRRRRSLIAVFSVSIPEQLVGSAPMASFASVPPSSASVIRDSVRWGIVGCGDVTERKSGPALQRASNSALTAVMRRDSGKAQDYAERHGVPRWYDSAGELLADGDVDAVYVATPPGSHLEVALQVAAAGKPCYMEKPMARSFNESRRMVSAFAAAGVPLFVAYYRRAYPRYQRLRALLESGKLGELSSVQYTMHRRAVGSPSSGVPAGIAGGASGWRQNVPVSGGGLFVDVGSHLLDLLDFLLGPLRDVRGVANRHSGALADAPEDVVSLSFLASRSAVGSASWNFRAGSDVDLLELVGDHGRVMLPESMNGAECHILFNDGTSDEHWEIPPPSPAVQEPLIQSVVDALLSGDASRCPSTAESALRTAGYLDAVLSDFYGGRDDAFWDRPETWPVNGERRVCLA